jgi:nuclear polyadenylated RNA-binding protein 3
MDPAFIKTGEPTANAVEALNNLQTANIGDDSEALDTGSSNTNLYDPTSTASIPEPKDTTMGDNEEHTEDSTNNQDFAGTSESSPTTNGDVIHSAISSPRSAANAETSPTTTIRVAVPAPTAVPTAVPIDLQALLSQLSPETLKVASPTTLATTNLPLLPPQPSSQSQSGPFPTVAIPQLPVPTVPATVTTSPNLPPNPLAGIHNLPPTPSAASNNNPPPSLPKPPHVRQRSMSQSSSVEDEGEGKPFTPEEEKAYDEFLSEEREYVSKGQWDRFPAGSRLFIGKRKLLGLC